MSNFYLCTLLEMILDVRSKLIIRRRKIKTPEKTQTLNRKSKIDYFQDYPYLRGTQKL